MEPPKYNSPALLHHMLINFTHNIKKIITVHDISEVSMFYNHFFIRSMNTNASVFTSHTQEALKNLYIIHNPHAINDIVKIDVCIMHKDMDAWKGDTIPVYIFSCNEDGTRDFQVKYLSIVNHIGIDKMKSLIRRDFIEAYIHSKNMTKFLEDFYVFWEYFNTIMLSEPAAPFIKIPEFYDYIDNGTNGMTIRLDYAHFLKDFDGTINSDVFKSKIIQSKVLRIDLTSRDIVDKYFDKYKNQGEIQRPLNSVFFGKLLRTFAQYAHNIENLEIYHLVDTLKYALFLSKETIQCLFDIMKRCRVCIVQGNFEFADTTLLVDMSKFTHMRHFELYNAAPKHKIALAMFNKMHSLKEMHIINNVTPFLLKTPCLEHLGLKTRAVGFSNKVYNLIPSSIKHLEIGMYVKDGPFAFDLSRFPYLERLYMDIDREPSAKDFNGFIKLHTSGKCERLQHISISNMVIFGNLDAPNLYGFSVKHNNVTQEMIKRIPKCITDLALSGGCDERVTLDIKLYPYLAIVKLFDDVESKLDFVGNARKIIESVYLVKKN